MATDLFGNSTSAAVLDPIGDAVVAKLAPIASQAAKEEAAQGIQFLTDAGAAMAARLQALEDKAVKEAEAVLPEVGTQFLGAVTAVSREVQHDKITQRHIALLVVAFLGAIVLAFVIAWLIGLPQAKALGAWGVSPGVGGLLVAWATVSFKLPKLPAPTA